MPLVIQLWQGAKMSEAEASLCRLHLDLRFHISGMTCSPVLAAMLGSPSRMALEHL